MTAETYVNDIVSRIKCSGKRRREIKEELLSEINARKEEGLEMDEIMKQIGSAGDVADSFNDNMSEKEKKKYSGSRMFMIIIPICLFIMFLVGAVIFVIPRQKDISKSKTFTEESITSLVKRDIERLNNGEYESLRGDSSAAMQQVIKDGLMESIQQQTGSEWGAFKGFGDIAIVEVDQAGQKFAVSEIKADYDNISVTFRLTYDSDMKLAGLYVR